MTQNYDGADRREFERTETDEDGIIVFPDGHTRLPCQLLNRSEGGVLLKINASEKLPGEFTLISGDPETHMVCRIAWRIGSRTGCEFICQLAELGVGNDFVLPVQSESKETVIESRLLRHPLIIS